MLFFPADRHIFTDMAGSSKRKRSSINCTFDPVTKSIRDGAVKSLANTYIEHLKKIDGKCKKNFVKGLVDQAKGSAGGLGITGDNPRDCHCIEDIHHELVHECYLCSGRSVPQGQVSI